MLNIRFLGYTKVDLQDLTVCFCGKWGIPLNVFHDLDLDPTKLNIELDRAIFIYYNVFQFHVPR